MIHIYFSKASASYRWIPGDRKIIGFFKKLFKRESVSGIERVYLNLCKGFDILKIPYTRNLPFHKIQPEDAVVMLGNEKYNSKEFLKLYHCPNPIIAGIGLMTHPSEWPDIFEQYPIAKYLQHCDWANNLYIRYFGEDRCAMWPAGIDTDKWKPGRSENKKYDVLVYNKIRWDHENQYATLRNPIFAHLTKQGLSYREIVYGSYIEHDYFELLKESRSMIFLCEHETQGFACCQAMSMNVPVFAWDPGFCRDPNRFLWNDPVFETTSVPFFSSDCGLTFKNMEEFRGRLQEFLEKLNKKAYKPRSYILENLTLVKSAQIMLEIIGQVYN